MKFGLIFTALVFCCSAVFSQHAKWKTLEIEADTLMAHEDYEAALVHYNQSIEASGLKDEKSYFSLYKRSICFYSLSQFENALQDIDRFIKLQPDMAQAKLLRAYIGRDLQNNEVQLSALGELLILDPKNIDLLKWRATAFVESGQYAEARRDIVVAKRIHNDPELETYHGMSFYYQEQPDSAILYFDKAIALDNTYITSYLYAGSLSLDQEAYDLALSYLNKGLQLDQHNLTLQFYKGIALVEKTNTIEGCRCLRKAFAGGVDDAGGYLKEFCYSAGE